VYLIPYRHVPLNQHVSAAAVAAHAAAPLGDLKYFSKDLLEHTCGTDLQSTSAAAQDMTWDHHLWPDLAHPQPTSKSEHICKFVTHCQ
jgi:hypothetical protein